MEPTSASFTRLRNGNWGVRLVYTKGTAPTRISLGSVVTVRRRDGEERRVALEQEIWRGERDGQIVILASLVYAPPRRNGYSTAHSAYSRHAVCAECGEPIRSRNQRCWETGATCYPE